MNASKLKINEFTSRYFTKFLSFFSIKSLIINAIAMRKPEAVKDSYPIANELKDKVGFSRINNKTK